MSLFARRASEFEHLRPGLALRTRNIGTGLRRSQSVRDTTYVTPAVTWETANFKDNYICVRKLGKGAQAAAYILSDIHLPTRQVVAKIYNDTPQNRKLVTNEIKVLKHLNRNGCKPFLLCFQRNFVSPVKSVSPICRDFSQEDKNVLVVVYDYFFGSGTQDLATLLILLAYTEQDYADMEYSERLYNNEIAMHVSQPEIQLQIILTLIRCVAYLHDNHVAHMDIKPANVVVNLRSGRIQLIDFGISCMESDCVPLGTPTHMAPEIVRLHGKKRSVFSFNFIRDDTEALRVLPIDLAMKADAWSIGVLLFELIHGQLPYDFPVEGLLYNLGHAKQSDILETNFVHPNQDVSDSISAVIDGFLTVEVSERLTVVEARDALAPLMDSILSPSSPTSPIKSSPKASPKASPLSPWSPSPTTPLLSQDLPF